MVAKSCRTCGRVTRGAGQCDTCAGKQEAARQAMRPNRQARGYDSEYDANARKLKDAVIRLQRYGGMRINCYRCGLPLGEDVSADHVLDLSNGGTNEMDNLRPSHKSCNSGHNRTNRPRPHKPR